MMESNSPTPRPQVPLIISDLTQLPQIQPPPTGRPLIAGTMNRPVSAAAIPSKMPAHQFDARGPVQIAPNTAPHTPPQKHRLTILGTPNGAIGSVGNGRGMPKIGRA